MEKMQRPWAKREDPGPPIVDGRVPPHDLDAEAAVLSAIMIDPGSLDRVQEFLKAND